MRRKPKPIFISFVEEGIFNPAYLAYVGGRIEVYDTRVRKDGYASEEIRFFTKKVDEYHRYRDRWDMASLTDAELNKMRSFVEENFHERIE